MGSRRRRDDGAEIARQLRTDSDALREAETWVRRRIYGLSDEEARWLYDTYKASYRAMLDVLTTAYDADGTVSQRRRAEVLNQVEREMEALYRQVFGHTAQSFEQAFLQGFYGRAWALDAATNQDVRIVTPLLPAEAVRAALLAPYVGTPWHEDLGYNFQEYTTRIKRSVSQSLIQGEGIQKAQRRLRDELGIQTDRRSGFQRNFYRTLLITRTEIMRASNLGAMSIYERNQDILRGWEWVATRDERTCPICGALDGKVYKFDDPQMAPPSGSHPGCRCTAVPVLIDTGLMDEVMGGPRVTYAEWAAQNGIFTDGGLDDQRASRAHGLNTTSG